jgi:hypothetical protein
MSIMYFTFFENLCDIQDGVRRNYYKIYICVMIKYTNWKSQRRWSFSKRIPPNKLIKTETSHAYVTMNDPK